MALLPLTRAELGPWADGPFALIPIPTSIEGNQPDHAALHCAAEMARVHNSQIRALNAVVRQAPYIPSAAHPGYRRQDVVDLLCYVRAWCKTLHHHHEVEEFAIFPRLEALAGQPGLMAGAVQQHALFHDGLEALAAYASGTAPEDYAWEGPGGMRGIIDGFGGALSAHLHEEIDVFRSLYYLDSAQLMEVWKVGENKAKKSGGLSMLYDVFPLMLGGSDKTFPGSSDFPPLPWFVPYMIKYLFAARNGAWRLNPCDFWGRPRPLYFSSTGKGRKPVKA